MNPEVQRTLLVSVMLYSAYTIAVCPCKQMGYCKKEQFLVLASIPMAFAVYNFIGEGGCET